MQCPIGAKEFLTYQEFTRRKKKDDRIGEAMRDNRLLPFLLNTQVWEGSTLRRYGRDILHPLLVRYLFFSKEREACIREFLRHLGIRFCWKKTQEKFKWG